MSIENVMYLALGAFAAGLVALLVMPAIWRRAVRLTRKRIEAATPMTMAEFRADKDRLRAEFALETRRLEATIEQLRARLTEEADDVDGRIGTLARMRQERDEQARIVAELEGREARLHDELHGLERQLADASQKLRMAERDNAHKSGLLMRLKEAARTELPAAGEPEKLTGDYERDIEALTAGLAIERKRAAFLEAQGRAVVAGIDKAPLRSSDILDIVAELRQALAEKTAEQQAGNDDDLAIAEARIAQAEGRLQALLDPAGEEAAGSGRPMLAERLSMEARARGIRDEIAGIERAIAADWGTGRADAAALRRCMDQVAALAQELVHGLPESGNDISLFERVAMFSESGEADEPAPDAPDDAPPKDERTPEDALQHGP